MTEPPPPPVPADADLQDFPFMPLHVARLRDSDLAAEEDPEACWYAVLLWAASWHQIPAGSLPNSDAVLMRLVGLGRDNRTWKKHRAGALRGFKLCSDERLYHSVVTEQVLASWRGKVEQRHRTECARIKKANQRNDMDDPIPTFDVFMSEHFPLSVPYLSPGTAGNVPREMPSKGERERQGKGQRDSNIDISVSDETSSSGEPDDDPVLIPTLELVGGCEPPPKPSLKPEHVVDAWNAMAARTGLPKVAKLSDERKRKLTTLIREYEIEDFIRAIAAIERSDFLRNGKDTWRGASFDFLIQKSTFLKLIEGQYDRQPTAR